RDHGVDVRALGQRHDPLQLVRGHTRHSAELLQEPERMKVPYGRRSGRWCHAGESVGPELKLLDEVGLRLEVCAAHVPGRLLQSIPLLQLLVRPRVPLARMQADRVPKSIAQIESV